MGALVTLLALAASAAPAHAQAALSPTQNVMAAEGDELDGLEVVADAELDQHRGGFTWEGVDIALGAEMRTILNGELVLKTNISWSGAGASHSQVVSGGLTAVDASQLQAGILSAGGVTMKVGDHKVFLANQGQTALLQRTDGSIQNIIVNRASNLQARMEVDAALDLQNFGQFQGSVTADRIGQAIADSVGLSTIGTLAN